MDTTILGKSTSAPILLAPIGVTGIVRPRGEVLAAQAAADLGLVTVLSNAASTSLEEVAENVQGGRRWFQLHWPADDALAKSLAVRAEKAGYEAIVVTVDSPALGWRAADLDNGLSPFRHGEGMANYSSDPVFQWHLGQQSDPADYHSAWSRLFGSSALRFNDLTKLADWVDLPILVKGICHPDDALRALDAGARGVVVSNHGGRQVDRGAAALDCLPPIVTAVGDHALVLFDSGIRSASDILVALALGADAVLLGRPWLYGLAIDGREGVDHVLRCLMAELDLALDLVGSPKVSGLRDKGILARKCCEAKPVVSP